MLITSIFSKSTRTINSLVISNLCKSGHSSAHFDRFCICRYPKDADKHLLAIKSGLTRSQVLGALATSLDLNVLVKRINSFVTIKSPEEGTCTVPCANWCFLTHSYYE